MFGYIELSFALLILINNLNAQLHLNKTILATNCACNPNSSSNITLRFKNIKTIDPTSFTGLISLNWLDLSFNQISSINPATFKGLTSLQLLYLDKIK